MFTGIVEEIGTVKSLQWSGQALKIKIGADLVLSDVKKGDSIATNGVCLTVVEFDATAFTADVMPETVKRTNFKDLKIGDEVNLERAMAADGRFGGHIVQGHVDGVGLISSSYQLDNATVLKIKVEDHLLELMVDQGSVAVDGISLTIVEVGADYFTVSIIPTTGKETILLKKRIGDHVNLECDIVGKYIRRLMDFREKTQGNLTEDFLREHGFM